MANPYGPVLLTEEEEVALRKARVTSPTKQLNRGVRGPCTVCLLPVGCRKIGESMIRQGCSVREVAEYLNWYLGKHPEHTSVPITHSSVSRHKIAAHFAIIQPIPVMQRHLAKDSDIMSLREFVQEAFKRFQLARSADWAPSYNEMIALMQAEARLSEIDEKRREDDYLKGLVSGIAYVKEIEEPA